MKSFGNHLALALSGALSLACANAARAQVSDNIVRVGVLNDISGIFQDTNGMGSVEAARMAAEDFNGGGKNIKVEIVYADHQNKADVGQAIARKHGSLRGLPLRWRAAGWRPFEICLCQKCCPLVTAGTPRELTEVVVTHPTGA